MRSLGKNIGGGVDNFIYDEANDASIIQSSYDLTDILENNKKLYNDTNNGWSLSREMKHVAEIPLAIAEKWLIEDGIDIMKKDHWGAIRRKLNDPEYRYLRTSSGRV